MWKHDHVSLCCAFFVNQNRPSHCPGFARTREQPRYGRPGNCTKDSTASSAVLTWPRPPVQHPESICSSGLVACAAAEASKSQRIVSAWCEVVVDHVVDQRRSAAETFHMFPSTLPEKCVKDSHPPARLPAMPGQRASSGTAARRPSQFTKICFIRGRIRIMRTVIAPTVGPNQKLW